MGNPGLPRWLSGIESTCQCRRHRFDPWVRKLPWGREWKSTPVFFPGKFPGQWSLVAYSPWGCKKSDKREQLNRHAHSPMAKRDFSHCRELDRALFIFLLILELLKRSNRVFLGVMGSLLVSLLAHPTTLNRALTILFSGLPAAL